MPVSNRERESFADQLSRLRSMAEDDGETWDLSENDRAALKAVTDSHDELLDVLKRFAAFPFAHQGVAEGPLAVMLQQAHAAIAKVEGR